MLDIFKRTYNLVQNSQPEKCINSSHCRVFSSSGGPFFFFQWGDLRSQVLGKCEQYSFYVDRTSIEYLFSFSTWLYKSYGFLQFLGHMLLKTKKIYMKTDLFKPGLWTENASFAEIFHLYTKAHIHLLYNCNAQYKSWVFPQLWKITKKFLFENDFAVSKNSK